MPAPEILTALPSVVGKSNREAIDMRFLNLLDLCSTPKDLTPALTAAAKWEEIKFELDGGKPRKPEGPAPGSALAGGDDE